MRKWKNYSTLDMQNQQKEMQHGKEVVLKLNVFAAIWHLYKNLQELRFVAQNTKPNTSH